MAKDDDKPAYRDENIQGDILPGFRSKCADKFKQTFLFYSVANAGKARDALAAIAPLVSSGADVFVDEPRLPDNRVFVNIAFTYEGINALVGTKWNRFLGAAFREGLAKRSSHRSLLGAAEEWIIGTADAGRVDMVVNVGSADADDLAGTIKRLRKALEPGYSLQYERSGEMLPGGIEHFGFKDGLAQPFVVPDKQLQMHGGASPASSNGWVAPDRSGAVWPNWDTLVPRGHRLKTRVGPGSLAFRGPGVPIRPRSQFVVSAKKPRDPTTDGSYMVWLQLQQRRGEFDKMCQSLADSLNAAWQCDISPDDAGALLVGRRRDGSSLEPSPVTEPNDFSYYDDPFARRCPVGAHIRLANPRDVQTAGAMILRRGIPYGPLEDDGSERGLLFICYQASIEDQYEKIQGDLANGEYTDPPPISRFPDPIISSRSREGSTVEIAEPYGRGSVGTRLKNTWVVPRGGLYLFVPSISSLHLLAQG